MKIRNKILIFAFIIQGKRILIFDASVLGGIVTKLHIVLLEAQKKNLGNLKTSLVLRQVDCV